MGGQTGVRAGKHLSVAVCMYFVIWFIARFDLAHQETAKLQRRTGNSAQVCGLARRAASTSFRFGNNFPGSR